MICKMDQVINAGLFGLCTNHYSTLDTLEYLDGRDPTIYNLAAFSWLVKLSPKNGDIARFLIKNSGYVNCFKQFGGYMNIKIAGTSLSNTVYPKNATK